MQTCGTSNTRKSIRSAAWETLEARYHFSLLSSSAATLPHTISTVTFKGVSQLAVTGRYIVTVYPKAYAVSVADPQTGLVDELTLAPDLQAQLQALPIPVTFERYLGSTKNFLVDIPKMVSSQQIINAFSSIAGFYSIDPDAVATTLAGGSAPMSVVTAATPTPTPRSLEWWQSKIGLNGTASSPGAWQYSSGSSSIVAALPDSGIDGGSTSTHDDLVDNLYINAREQSGASNVDDDGNGYVDDISGYDFYGNSKDPTNALPDNNPNDQFGHGTVVTGALSADGTGTTNTTAGGATTGTSLSTTVLPLKVSYWGGGSNENLLESDAIEAFNYIDTMHALMTASKIAGANIKVVNVCFSFEPALNGETRAEATSGALKNAIKSLEDDDILVVCAALNDHENMDTDPTVFYQPQQYDNGNVLVVAATEQDDTLADFPEYMTDKSEFRQSNTGTISVDLAAPGGATWTPPASGTSTSSYNGLVAIETTAKGNLYDSEWGTSMAAPQVSAVAAMAWAINPDLTFDQVRQAILSNVDVISGLKNDVASSGRLDAAKTLKYVYQTLTGYNYDSAYAGVTRSLLGDAGGNPKNDTLLLRLKSGDSTKVELVQNGKVVGTWPNSSAYRLGVYGLAGNDNISIASGISNPVVIDGGTGNDTVTDAGSGHDTIYGGDGDDTIMASGSGHDTIYGNGGDDLIQATGGGAYLYGGDGDDVLHVNGGANTLQGDAGTDHMYNDGTTYNNYFYAADGEKDYMTGSSSYDHLKAYDSGLDIWYNKDTMSGG